MSKPPNSAARNTMTPMERQCYDWGWEDAEERIIKLLEDEVRHDFPPIIEMSLDNLKALIKGEQK